MGIEPVWCEQYDLWVHPGISGFWDAGVQGEMNDTHYYRHRPIESPLPVIIDVGGHIGVYSRDMARRYPQGRIFCIEPHPDNCTIAAKNLEPFPNVTLIQGAVTYEPGVALHPFRLGSNSGGSQLLPENAATFENSCEHDKPIQVQAFTLERLVEFYGLARIDLLKLDCEGSEYSILAKAKCLSRVKEIVGEWHRVPGVPTFDEFCREHLPGWAMETEGPLTGAIGMFRLTAPQPNLAP